MRFFFTTAWKYAIISLLGGVYMMPYIWLALLVLEIIFEAATAALVSVWFIPPTLVCIVLAFLAVPLWIQILVFFVLSGICLALFKTVLRDFFKVKKTPTNADSHIGKCAIVTEKISMLENSGAVKIGGIEWSAAAEDENETIETGVTVKIVDIRGVKLICKKCD